MSGSRNADCFAKVNREAVDKLFFKKCKTIFSRRISRELIKILPVKEELFFIYDKLALRHFADFLVSILENRKIRTWRLKNNIPSEYCKHDPILILIDQLWLNAPFDTGMFNKLTDKQKLQLNAYILKTSVYKTGWFLKLIRNDKILLQLYLRKFKKPKRIISLFKSVLNVENKYINELLKVK